MHATLRPYATAGISLVGATAIAISPISPITPALPDIKVPAIATSSAAVDLVVNPIDFYSAVFGRTVDNVGALAEIFLENPAPILSQIIANQVVNFEMISNALTELVGAVEGLLETQIPVLVDTAFAALREGDIETALNSFLSIPVTLFAPIAFIGLGAALLPISTAANNINNVIQDVLGGAILAGALGVFGPVLSTVGATGTAIQGVIDGVMAGDIGEVFDAVVNAPGVIVDGLLNGGYGPPLLGFLPAPGLLSPTGLLGPVGAGPIGVVLAIRNLIAEAITPEDANQRTAGDPGGLPEANNAAFNDGELYSLKLADNSEDSITPISDEPTEEGEGADPAEEDGGEEGANGEEGGDTGGDEGDNTGTTSNGGTDLSGGNKVEPRGTANSATKTDSDSDDQQAGGSSGGSSDSGKRGTRSSREG